MSNGRVPRSGHHIGSGVMKKIFWLLILIIPIIVVAVSLFTRYQGMLTGRGSMLREWFATKNPEWMVDAGERCGDAVFISPTRGYIGFLWDDSFRPGHHHSGIDIFGGEEPGITPVVAAADGYLTRLPEWKSTVIIRVSDDPLDSSRQIWLYYTHMASVAGKTFIEEKFPSGSVEVPVKAGDLLGYQGNYSGDPVNPTGVHLHFSIVMDDGRGEFLSELEIENTLDPSPYFQLPLNGKYNTGDVPMCSNSNYYGSGK